jgi:hypothetical protein
MLTATIKQIINRKNFIVILLIAVVSTSTGSGPRPRKTNNWFYHFPVSQPYSINASWSSTKKQRLPEKRRRLTDQTKTHKNR